MSEEQEFERAWLAKLSTCLDAVVGEGIRKEVMKGSGELSSHSDSQEVIVWSRGAMERLDSLVDEAKRKEIMTGCACRYPKSELRQMRQKYEETEDIDLVHQMLQEQLESFLRDTLELGADLVEEIARRGWGLAGVKKGDRIVATKIPKSGNLVDYMRETDPEVRRQHYCHCPRVRDVLKSSETISPTYCYCGAGFYKGVWEDILQEPVEVEVLETVLKGDEVCRIAIYLPSDQ
jgi:predicted hydrocarbon binding protein